MREFSCPRAGFSFPHEDSRVHVYAFHLCAEILVLMRALFMLVRKILVFAHGLWSWCARLWSWCTDYGVGARDYGLSARIMESVHEIMVLVHGLWCWCVRLWCWCVRLWRLRADYGLGARAFHVCARITVLVRGLWCSCRRFRVRAGDFHGREEISLSVASILSISVEFPRTYPSASRLQTATESSRSSRFCASSGRGRQMRSARSSSS